MPTLDAIEAWLEERFASLSMVPPPWLSSRAFSGQLAALISDAEAPFDALDALHLEDLYLAASAASAVSPACATLEERIRRNATLVVTRMRGDQSAADEVASEVIEKLLVGDGERGPQIGSYRGRGSLAAWLRATISRAHLNLRRKHRREVLVGDDNVFANLEDPGDPTLDHIKRQYRSEFGAALEGAIGALTDRQRALLRYRFVDGATVDAIAAVYRVHRATCHRWISDARAALAKETERGLRDRLRLSSVGIESVRALIESQLDLSLSRMFR